MRHLCILLLYFNCLTVIGQGFVFIGEKRFSASSTISFRGSGGFLDLKIQFAKKGDGSGFILLSKETHSKHVFIGGTVWVYLDDGKILKCYDKGTRDYANDISTTIYNLTKQEIDILKETNIQSIRYSTKCTSGVNTGSCDENFIAENKEGFVGSESFNLPLMLKELYDECFGVEGFNEAGDRIINYPPKPVSSGTFAEYGIGLSTNGDEKYISLVQRNTLITGSNEIFANELIVTLINGGKLSLQLINSTNQMVGGDKTVLGVYYLEQDDIKKLVN